MKKPSAVLMALTCLLIGFIIGISSNGWLTHNDPWRHNKYLENNTQELAASAAKQCEIDTKYSVFVSFVSSPSSWMPTVEVVYRYMYNQGKVIEVTEKFDWQNQSLGITCP